MNSVLPVFDERPRPPHRRRSSRRLTPERANAIRKLVTVAIIVSAALVGWWLADPWRRSETGTPREALQHRAREKIGHGLDELFARQLRVDNPIVELEVDFDVAAELDTGDHAISCAQGFDEAFTQALGSGVVKFSALGSDPTTRLVVRAKLTPSGQRFRLPHASEEYPGIRMSAEMMFLGHDVHADVQSAANIDLVHLQLGPPSGRWSASEVAGAIMQSTCKQAGYALLEALTTWRRPPPAPLRVDPMAECERGFHCRAYAEMLEATDRATAAELYAKSCEDDDELACLRTADLEVELSRGGDGYTRARVRLERACARGLAGACVGAGRLALLPQAPGDPADRQLYEALVLYLRACDLGARDACAAAEPLLEGTAFAEAASLLTGATSVTSPTLGTIFALRWGQWTTLDRGQPTMWVTGRPLRVPDGAIVTPFEIHSLPWTIVAPAGVTTVYAVALDGGRGGDDARCDRCMPSGGDRALAMGALQCVCALAPRSRPRP